MQGVSCNQVDRAEHTQAPHTNTHRFLAGSCALGEERYPRAHYGEFQHESGLSTRILQFFFTKKNPAHKKSDNDILMDGEL